MSGRKKSGPGPLLGTSRVEKLGASIARPNRGGELGSLKAFTPYGGRKASAMVGGGLEAESTTARCGLAEPVARARVERRGDPASRRARPAAHALARCLRGGATAGVATRVVDGRGPGLRAGSKAQPPERRRAVGTARGLGPFDRDRDSRAFQPPASRDRGASSRPIAASRLPDPGEHSTHLTGRDLDRHRRDREAPAGRCRERGGPPRPDRSGDAPSAARIATSTTWQWATPEVAESS